ncbi:hypothetical protein CDL15_Pgr008519 [Punica granatum]|uniref:Uncharacterized protein n=1 Tax=Punica granatum TaxID=22663 RepID=A0A218WNI8_PUNGR|nr:hypothetical protein CDL15_Pgr008519 [Punica granatum]
MSIKFRKKNPLSAYVTWKCYPNIANMEVGWQSAGPNGHPEPPFPSKTQRPLHFSPSLPSFSIIHLNDSIKTLISHNWRSAERDVGNGDLLKGATRCCYHK